MLVIQAREGGVHVITPMALMETIRASQCQQSEQMCEKWSGGINILWQENKSQIN